MQNHARVWVLTDGKIGDDVQCLAIARALSPEFEKRVISPGMPWSLGAPWGPIDPRDRPERNPNSPIAGEAPDIVIVSGRRSIPYGLYLKKSTGAKLVIMKDPRFGRRYADFIWAPAHDRLAADNVFSTVTSPHSLTPQIASARTANGSGGAALEQPSLGVVLGGPSGGATYADDDARDLSRRLREAANDYASLAVVSSRRTPERFVEALKLGLEGTGARVWNGEGDNPYLETLAHARTLIVAGDSHNMVSEALATGIGVYVWKPAGLADKLNRFVDKLVIEGVVREYVTKAPAFDAAPIDATPIIVSEIRNRLL